MHIHIQRLLRFCLPVLDHTKAIQDSSFWSYRLPIPKQGLDFLGYIKLLVYSTHNGFRSVPNDHFLECALRRFECLDAAARTARPSLLSTPAARPFA